MNESVARLKEEVIRGGEVTFDQARWLYDADSESLFEAADTIREFFCGNQVDLCAIMNAKSGGCEENCAYCAQSRHYFTGVQEYPLVDVDAVLARARENEQAGVKRFSLVTSGRALTGEEFEQILRLYDTLRRHTSMALDASLGCLSYDQLCALRSVGVSTYHHNLETGPRFFPRICSTHTFEDRVATIEAAQRAGLAVCSGGIFGMGESVEDRLEMACVLRTLGVVSVPINVLVPIPGTPLEHQEALPLEDVYRTIAVYRFLLPRAMLRFAGGRVRLGEGHERAYRLGINAALVGNLLTTVGNTIEEDVRLIRKMGLEV